jgi:hypothetical protein
LISSPDIAVAHCILIGTPACITTGSPRWLPHVVLRLNRPSPVNVEPMMIFELEICSENNKQNRLLAHRMQCATAISGQYLEFIRAQFSDNFLSFCEMEVYGKQ